MSSNNPQLLLATSSVPDGFGARDVVAMVLIGVVVTVVWFGFWHLNRLSHRKSDDEPPKR